MMERLTEKQSSGYDLKAMNGEWCNKYCEKQIAQTCNECVIYQAIQKLAEYENAEEQGLLLRLPCKVGDTVYIIKSDGKIVTRTADMQFLGVLWDDYGKEWFLTQAEAEQKLKEMESDCNDEAIAHAKEVAEELKALRLERLLPTTNEIIASKVGYETGYNKAIDDFVKSLKDYFVIPHDVHAIEMKAKQLKEGVKNED